MRKSTGTPLKEGVVLQNMNIWFKTAILGQLILGVACQSQVPVAGDNKIPEPSLHGLNGFYEAIQKKPDSIELYQSLVDSLANRKLFADAARWCDSAMKQKPPVISGWLLAKGDLYRMAFQYDSAAEAYKAYLALFPDDEQILLNLANTYAEKGDPEALSLSRKIAGMFPSDETIAGVCFIQGMYFSVKQDYPQSRLYFDSAIALRYNFTEAWMERGFSFFDEEKYRDASLNFLQLTNLNKGNAEAWYWLGKSEEAQGHKDKAADYYARAYSLDRTLTDALQALERLRKKES